MTILLKRPPNVKPAIDFNELGNTNSLLYQQKSPKKAPTPILSTPSSNVNFDALQPLNVYLPIVLNLLPNFNSDTLIPLSQKAPSSIDTMFLGISTSLRRLQSANASTPIDVVLSLNQMRLIDEPLNAKSPTFVKLFSGISTSEIFTSAKAYEPIVVTPSSTTTLLPGVLLFIAHGVLEYDV